MYVELKKAVTLFLLAHQEINTAKERSHELIEKVLRRSNVILDGLLSLAKSPHKDILARFEERLADYRK